MRSLTFSILLALLACPALAQQTKYEQRIGYYQSKWQDLIPTHFKMQYAGSMGILSMGIGWDYGKRNQWETDIILGFVPKYSTRHSRMTFTVKQNFMPWNIPLGERGFFFEPLTCGLYVNTIAGNEFWSTEPDKYPSGYYNLSTKVRFHVFAGERITYVIPPDKRFWGFKEVTFFYEISTSDLYVVSAATNSYLKPYDYLKLSLGLKFQFF